MHNSSRNQIIVTFKDRVLVTEGDNDSVRTTTNCTSEEADALVVWRARDAVSQCGFIHFADSRY